MGMELKPRIVERKRVLMKARIITADGRHDVRVTDLTAFGARISAGRRLDVDSDIILERGTLFVAARVIWWRTGEGGIQFYRELPLAEVSAMFNPVFETEPA